LSPSERFPFSVEVRGTAPGSRSEDALITVLDGYDEVRATGEGRVDAQLPTGLYAVQVERAGFREEHVRRHTGPTNVAFDEPKRFSAVPAADTVGTHEYYEEPARRWSREATAPRVARGPAHMMGSLFAFLRAPSADAPTAALEATDLRLLDAAGEELLAFDGASTQRDEHDGWIAFHAAAPAGEYALRSAPSDSAPARDVALWVFAGWQTQVFMTLADGASFASASVLMGHVFEPDDRVTQAVDAALTGLQNGVDLLVGEQWRLLLAGKFDNPMLGLVGAHVLLRRPSPNPEVIGTVLSNLEWLLGRDAPDVRALWLVAERRFGWASDAQPFERPPMLRAGLEAVLEAAVERPELVPRDGLLARIALQRFVDSPWTTWRPLAPTGARRRGAAGAPDWVSGYVEHAAFEAARKDAELDVGAAAAHASLPVETVAGAYDRLRADPDAGAGRKLALERLVTQARRGAKALRLDPADVRRQFLEGGEHDRARALGWMQGDPRVRDLDVVLAAIRDPRSAFEQYQALEVARRMLPRLAPPERAELAEALRAQRAPGAPVEPGSARWFLAGELLDALGAGAEPVSG
jgi:hypothetical protein